MELDPVEHLGRGRADVPGGGAGQRQTLVIGVGHGTCTCEGAAFECTFNVEHELRTRGLRDLADVIYLSNEYELGDFGVGGMVFRQQGFISSSQIWTESLFRERGVKAILRAHVERVEPGKIYYETLDGNPAASQVHKDHSVPVRCAGDRRSLR